MLLEQLLDGDGACTALVACAETRAAALVDPHPDHLPLAAAVVASRRLTVQWVLETRGPALSTADRVARFRGLVGDLGLSATEVDAGVRPVSLELASLPRIRPLRPWSSPGVVLEVGARIVELVPGCPDLGRLDTARVDRAPIQLTFGEVVARVGGLVIEVVPLPDRPGTVAYAVADRLFIGCPVLAGTEALPAEGTPRCLLDRPGHHVVHAGEVRNGVGSSTIALERAAHATRSRLAVAPRPASTWAPRLVRGGRRAHAGGHPR